MANAGSSKTRADPPSPGDTERVRSPVRQLSGKMRRSASAAQFLDMLSYFNVHFRIEGKRIIVTA